jgi:hypothetical protein
MVDRVRRWLPALVALTAAPAAPAVTHAQQSPAPARSAAEALRVFVDCDFCDFDYLRVETPWVDFVRDRTVADVHLLITRQQTGAGGSLYTIHALGQGAFRGRQDTLAYSTEPAATQDARRSELARNVQLGLVPYVLRTARGRTLRVATPGRAEAARAPTVTTRDPWNAWVFEVESGASLEREQQQSEVSASGELGARRITEALKLGAGVEGNFERSRFTLDDGRIVTNLRESYEGGVVAVKSMGGHWGTGAELLVGSSTFQNTRLAVRVAPAVEYSVWPYAEATRRQLTIQYSVGSSAFRYREETIFGRLSETRPTQALVVGYDVRQPWGSAEVTTEASSFLDDRAQYRLVGDAELRLRIVRGLQLEVGGNAALIRDQLSIVKRDATPEEILLQRRALRTDYRFDTYIGLSYTFGSIFNSVVNPRFGTGPGDILR